MSTMGVYYRFVETTANKRLTGRSMTQQPVSKTVTTEIVYSLIYGFDLSVLANGNAN